MDKITTTINSEIAIVHIINRKLTINKKNVKKYMLY